MGAKKELFRRGVLVGAGSPALRPLSTKPRSLAEGAGSGGKLFPNAASFVLLLLHTPHRP